MFGERLRRGASREAAIAGNQHLYLNGTHVAQMSDTLPIALNSAALGIGRYVSGIADPFNGRIDAFRIARVQRSDGWIETTWNNMSDPGAFAVAGAEEQEGEQGVTARWRTLRSAVQRHLQRRRPRFAGGAAPPSKTKRWVARR